MKDIPFVLKRDWDTALDMEDELLALPKQSGILFVGVSVEPLKTPIFNVTIGCSRKVEKEAIQQLAHLTLTKRFSAYSFTVQVFRGQTELQERLTSALR